MDAKTLVDEVLAGTASLDEVERWVEANRDRYRRPPLMEAMATANGRDRDRLIDDYADWEIRAGELERLLHGLSDIALGKDRTERGVRAARLVEMLSKLVDSDVATAQGALTLGYVLWRNEEYFDAADALREAATLFEQARGEPLREVTALSYLSDALRQDKQFDEAIECAIRLRERARSEGFCGHEASALRVQGLSQAALGRGDVALELLREALGVRRSLSDAEAREQSVGDVAVFVNDLAVTARTFGDYDEAFVLFLENAERHRQRGEHGLEARALSEIGYTYNQSGERGRAIEYLERAADLGFRHGLTSDAHRWRLQIATMRGDPLTPAAAQTEGEEAVLDADHAYLLAERALQLGQVGEEKEAAVQAAHRALRWAVGHRDPHLQVVCHNVLGILGGQQGETQRSIEHFQQGIKLADGGGGGAAASLMLRRNLAEAYLRARDLENCTLVLETGFAHGEFLLARTVSLAVRQQVLAGMLPLYELYALLLSRTDAAPNHETLLAFTDQVRTKNMATWARLEASIESFRARGAVVGALKERLKRLRAAEVELDFRHATDALTHSQAESLRDEIRKLESEIKATATGAGLRLRSSRSPADWRPSNAMQQALARVLEPGTAILSLFAVPEGVCPAIFASTEQGVVSAGSLVPWEREERSAALTRWAGQAALLRSRALRPRDLGQGGTAAGISAAAPEELLTRLLEAAREALFDPLVELVNRLGPRRLGVVPHRELALLPYWPFLDRCESVEALAVAPSLSLLDVCVSRSRGVEGETAVVPDATQTLPQARFELATVQAARPTPVRSITKVEQLLEAGPGCNLLHAATHGVFNPANPYRSGFIVGSSEATGLFVQYASLVKTAGGHSFTFSGAPQARSFRLMTVAECLASLSLERCRLAVLSSCECGLADPHAGGELTGLPTSLLVCGAKSVIAALWPVSDAATALLMDRFYRAWQGGLGEEVSPARALATARRQVREIRRAEIRDLLGPDAALPSGPHPFADPIYSDAFHCFGAW